MEDSHGFIEMFIFADSDEADAWKNNRGRQAILFAGFNGTSESFASF
jgi:hypothetical protein